ncbi:hypothetical protein DSECCO2_514240 [anaerobic digester metagenome]
MTGPAPVIVALVPMRHASERVPGKNYRDFGGIQFPAGRARLPRNPIPRNAA